MQSTGGRIAAGGGLFAAGLFAAGLFAGGLFAAGLFAAGLFAGGLFAAGLFAAGLFAGGLFASGLNAGGLFASGLNAATRFVKRNIHSSSELVKTRAYQAIVRPSLEYATCVWDPHTQIAKQKLEAVQRRAARYVTRRYHNTSSVTNMLRHLEWQTLEQRKIATNLTMLYKITNNIVTVPIHTYLTPWTRPLTRSHNLCYMPCTKYSQI